MKITEIDHFSHRHKLELSYSEKPYQCDGCKELGFGSSYQCNNKKCDFHLHENCGLAKPIATHSFFKNSSFKFKKKGKRGKTCKACGKDVQGFMYKSKEAYLHPCCLELPSTLNGNFNGGSLRLNLEVKASTKCLICQNKEIYKGKLKGWAYISSCGKHCYHVGCVNNMNFENWKMGYFNQSQSGGVAKGLVFNKEENGESSNGRKENEGSLMKNALDFIVKAVLGDAVTSFLGIDFDSIANN
ncbi:hypothetical protein E1A91_D10G265500v1 [Gossypium mustelinum]|uniref:DC1 domain-containing protein n=2 Tax=Gossypium TaxID=3633 RepID=A0A5D2TCD8_GOSMU|nr:hypothetical protein ES332_D10G281200v1 [Gossypium tomentosum]TYH51522.1 hypothetical protein ES332_D10G281500v1 [Gossypium tomentosum]TYH51525.1 hypothetical protein ES332_D10G281800v1 [Gossypium tomentosum]TYI62700.1 hypothetical protein E1A91_D10G265500v1 [Gossypium mustelinum]